MKSKALINLDSRQSKIIANVFESLNQTHIDLAELCAVVCSGECASIKAFSEIRYTQKRIEDMCKTLEAPSEDSPFFDMYEEIDLAGGFLTCLLITIWTQEKLPTQQQLEYSEATVIYAVLFAAMHRIENALKPFSEMTV